MWLFISHLTSRESLPARGVCHFAEVAVLGAAARVQETPGRAAARYLAAGIGGSDAQSGAYRLPRGGMRAQRRRRLSAARIAPTGNSGRKWRLVAVHCSSAAVALGRHGRRVGDPGAAAADVTRWWRQRRRPLVTSQTGR